MSTGPGRGRGAQRAASGRHRALGGGRGPIAATAGRVVALLLLTAAAIAAADLRTAVTIDARMSAASHPEETLLLGSGGSARLDLVATGNRNVRGQLSIAADLHLPPAVPGAAAGAAGTDPDHLVTSVGVERAFIRARLPGFRLTAGKTRLSWGRGRFFNAGDILFGQEPGFASGASEYLTATDWLVAAYVPVDRLSFLEAVVLPAPLPARLADTAAAARAVIRLGELTGEAGYRYGAGRDAAAEPEHRGYVSLKGALIGVDWHLSAGSALPAHGDTDLSEAAQDRLYVTAGGFGFVDLGPESGLLSLRLEAGVRPWRTWQEEPGAPAALDRYGLYLFPEVGFAPADNWNLSLSGVISPIDGSAVAAAGASWNMLQGLTFSLYAAAMLGDSDDTFAWGGSGSLAATLAARFVFGSS